MAQKWKTYCFEGYALRHRAERRGDHVVLFVPRRRQKGLPDAEVLIDIEDLPLLVGLGLYVFKVDRKNTYAGYQAVGPDGKPVSRYLHRLIMDAPRGMVVDHWDHDGLNDRRANLRVITHAENLLHRAGPNPNTISGIRGVTWIKKSGKWLSTLKSQYGAMYFGEHATKEEAELHTLYALASRTGVVPMKYRGRNYRTPFLKTFQTNALTWNRQGRPFITDPLTPWRMLGKV